MNKPINARKWLWLLTVLIGVRAAQADLATDIVHLFGTDVVGVDGVATLDPLIQTKDGSFYGASGGGSNNCGLVYKISSTGDYSKVFTFDYTNGIYPQMILGRDGNFYGTTLYGLSESNEVTYIGTAFKLTPQGGFTKLFAFNGTNGQYAQGLVEGIDGNFYGVTTSAGLNHVGNIYKLTRTGKFTELVSFNGRNGAYPFGKLVQGRDGNFYGVTLGVDGSVPGHNYVPPTPSTIFMVTPKGRLLTLFRFNGQTGSFPTGGLTLGRDGYFYGLTATGGKYSVGTAYKFSPFGKFTVLNSFEPVEYPSNPRYQLYCATDGRLFGSTEDSIFCLTPQGTLTTLVKYEYYDESVTGGLPSAIMQGKDGNFYAGLEYAPLPLEDWNHGLIFRMTGTPLYFTAQPSDVKARNGANARLGAIAKTTGKASYQWRKWDELSFVWFDLDDTDRMTGTHGPNLYLKNLNDDDYRSYSLVVGSAAGTVTSRTVMLSKP